MRLIIKNSKMEIEPDFNSSSILNLLKKYEKSKELITPGSPEKTDKNLYSNKINFKEYRETNRIQYYNIFNLRFQQLRSKLISSIKTYDSNLEIVEDTSYKKKNLAVIGVTFKEIPNRPNILKGVEAIFESKLVESFISNKDTLYLENPSIRIKIRFDESCNLKESEFVSGLVLGFM